MSLPLEKQESIPGILRDLHEHEDFVVWKNPQGTHGTLALLTSERVIFADPGSPATIDRAISEFRSNGRMPSGAHEIIAESIFKISFDKRSTDMTIYYAKNDRERETHSYDFGNPTARDSFVEAFTEEFGDRFVDRTQEHTPLTAALRPLCLGGAIATLTWALYLTAHQTAPGAGSAGPSALLSSAVELVGPPGILLVGGLSLAITMATLIRRVAHPPILRTLSEKI